MNPLEGIGVIACVVAFIAAVAAAIKFASWLAELAAEVRNIASALIELRNTSRDRNHKLSCRISTIEEAFQRSAADAAEQLKGL